MNKKDVNRTQPKGCSTSDLDAAIEYLEPFSKEIPLISEYDTPEDIEWDKKRIMVNNLSYTALKFMKLSLEKPSSVIEALEFSNLSFREITEKLLKEVQGE